MVTGVHAIVPGTGIYKGVSMHEHRLLTPIINVIGLLFLAAISAICLKRIRFPDTIGLVLAYHRILNIACSCLVSSFGLPVVKAITSVSDCRQ